MIDSCETVHSVSPVAVCVMFCILCIIIANAAIYMAVCFFKIKVESCKTYGVHFSIRVEGIFKQ